MRVRNWLFVLAAAGAIVALAHFQSATLDEAVKESRREKLERLSAAVTPPPTTPEPTPAPTPQPTPEPTPAPTPVPKAVDSATRSTPRKGDSIGEWFEFWTGQPLTADVVPISAGTKIPNRIFMTWKTKDLPTQPMTARGYWDNWGRMEPQLDRVILDDAECAVLATFFPELKPRYDALPLNVMRADVCRVLAIYYFGGYYKDLDVDHRKQLRTWISDTADIAYGWEDEEHLCQWFFAATPGHPCVYNILQHMTNIIANASLIDFKKNIEAVIDITGPGVWTDAMQGCPTAPKYSVHEMKFTNVYHDYASQRWGGAGYKPWTEARKEVAGLESVWPSYHIAPYFLSKASEHMMPPNMELPVIEVTRVRQSSLQYHLAPLSGPQNAFDGRLDTHIATDPEIRPWFEFTFVRPMTIGTVVVPDENHLSGIRVYNRHREAGANDFAEGLHMELYDETDHMFHHVSKQKRMATFYLFNLAGMMKKLKRVRFFKNPDPEKQPRPHRPRMTFSEIQLYSDHLSLSARRITVQSAEASTKDGVPQIYTLATTVPPRPTHLSTAPCDDGRALSPFLGFQYTYCGSPPSNCSAFSITAQPRTEVDSAFVAAMQNMGCPLTAVGPVAPAMSRNVAHQPRWAQHINTSWCATNAVWKRCDVLEAMVAATGLREASFVYLDVYGAEWASEHSILALLDDFDAEIVFIPMRFTSDILESATLVANFKKLLTRYELYASHVNPGEGILSVGGLHLPKELHLSFRRKRVAG
jgi:hypothetical protein